jgi:hypothetical protein
MMMDVLLEQLPVLVKHVTLAALRSGHYQDLQRVHSTAVLGEIVHNQT